ncbi:FKBP-type peptidyl-prolyl cis-trans isomerase [uncultured archaeon]|nr:FKBP-type peptidyl-prolyl cis-trans isomerase [uncultured archaeon]
MKSAFVFSLTLLSALVLFGCVASTNTNTTAGLNPVGLPTASTTPQPSATATPAASASASGAVSAASGARVVKVGDSVAVDYVGTLDNGTVFDTSIEAKAKAAGMFTPGRSYEPLPFTVGAGQMIAGFDKGVVGMKLNETKTIHIAPADAYGEYDAKLVQLVPLKQLQDAGLDPQVGMTLTTTDGQRARVTARNSTTVTADFNHPLAGQALNFEITLREIK